MRIRTSSRLGIMILLMAVLTGGLAITGCGSSNSSENPGTGVAMEPSTGLNEDFQPVAGPAGLDKLSSVVVEGVTGAPQEGRIWGASPKDPGALTSIVVPISVSQVLSGQLDPTAKGTVYLELFANDGADRSSIEDGMADRDGVFYLYRMPDTLSKYTEIVNVDAGRPSGQPLYQPASPQGTFVEEKSGEGVWSVGTAESFPSASLDDVSPGEKSFPPTEERE